MARPFPVFVRGFMVAALLVAVGCSSDDSDPGWKCSATVDVTGVWDVSRTPSSGTGIYCPDVDTVWTLYQNACDVTVSAQSWDPANGRTGTITGNRLQMEWVYFEGCYRYEEDYDVTIDGNTMSGVYYLSRVQWVFPADCPGTGLCSSTVTGTRRVP